MEATKQKLDDGSLITGSSVVLKKFHEGLVSDDYVGWLNDKDLMRFSQQSTRSHSRRSCIEYVRSFEESPNHFWSIHRVSDGKQIGTMTAYVDETSLVADIGILVGAADTRGSGAGKEAWGLAMQFLFEKRGMRKITGGTLIDNVAMVRIFEHHKMLLEATLRKEQVLNGREYDIVRYGLLREEWLANFK